MSLCDACDENWCCICDGTAESCPDQPDHPYMGLPMETVATVLDEPKEAL